MKWYELSYNKFDCKRNMEQSSYDAFNNNYDGIDRYGLYEDLYKTNTFGVEEAFNCEEY